MFEAHMSLSLLFLFPNNERNYLVWYEEVKIL